MTSTHAPAPTSTARTALFGPWARVFISAALLGCIGSVLGSTLLFGVVYAKMIAWKGRLPLEDYFKLRDVGESAVLTMLVMWGYRRWPAMHRTLQSEGGVLKVSALVGGLTLVVMRFLVYKTGLPPNGNTLLALLLYVTCIAFPIVWTIARRAPDAPGRTNSGGLTETEFLKTSGGLFLTVACVFFMHWVMYSDTVFNFFALFVIPIAAIFLGIGVRQLMGGVARKLEWAVSNPALTTSAVLIAVATTVYWLFFAHPPKRW